MNTLVVPKAHIAIACPYCGNEQVHSQSFKSEAHQCALCERTFVVIPHIQIKRVEGEATKHIRVAA